MRATLVVVVALALLGCRGRAPATPRAPFDHHRPDYSTAARAPQGAEAELYAALARANSPRTDRTVLDERLSVVATELAEHGMQHQHVSFVDLVGLARDAGSPLFPILAATVDSRELSPDWADVLVAAVPGSGPLAIGIHAPDDATAIVVFARAIVQLGSAVPRTGATRFEFTLHADMRAYTPSLLIVTERGITRLPARPVAEGRWVAEREEGFAGTTVAIIGTKPTPADGSWSTKGTSETLAGLHFGATDPIGPANVSALPAAIASVRRSWNVRPLAIVADDATACGPNVTEIGGTLVTLRQRCITWTSEGDDRARWRALLVNPLVLEAVTDATWEIAELRRDANATSIRVAREFADVSADEAYIRLTAMLRERWPGIHHDEQADRIARELATSWAIEPLTPQSIASVAARSEAAAARWSKQPRFFRVAWSDQDLAEAFDLLQPDVIPTAYTLGVVRGTGPEGEPRWYVVALLALPAA